jgi:hypothetical protein
MGASCSRFFGSDLGDFAMGRPVPADMIQPICCAVGRIVVHWSFVEQALELCMTQIYHSRKVGHSEKNMQKFLGRKIEFLRKTFKLPSLSAFSAEATEYLDSAEKLSLVRHGVVHGGLDDCNPETGEVLFSKLDLPNLRTKHEITEIRTTLNKLMSDGDACQSLAIKLQSLCGRLLETLMPEYQRK